MDMAATVAAGVAAAASAGVAAAAAINGAEGRVAAQAHLPTPPHKKQRLQGLASISDTQHTDDLNLDLGHAAHGFEHAAHFDGDLESSASANMHQPIIPASIVASPAWQHNAESGSESSGGMRWHEGGLKHKGTAARPQVEVDDVFCGFDGLDTGGIDPAVLMLL